MIRLIAALLLLPALASVEIARLLFVSGRIPPAERDRTRRDLLELLQA